MHKTIIHSSRQSRFLRRLAIFLIAVIVLPCASRGGEPKAKADPVPTAEGFLYPHYTTSWLGNSFGGPLWVQRYTDDLYVSPDGTCYMATGWDEGGREYGIYKDGKVVGAATETHGWGTGGGSVVTANSHYLFIGEFLAHLGDESGDEWPPSKTTWFGVARRNLDGSRSTFPGGKGHGAKTSGGMFLPINTVVAKTPAERPSAPITGLAASDTQLFVANAYAGEVDVYDSEKMTKITSWPLARAGHMAYDPASKSLWILQAGENDAPDTICHYTADGKSAGPKLPLPPGTIPTALAISPQGELLVGDSGPAQDVLIFNNLAKGPVLARTFGDKGGIYSGPPGQVAPLKLASPAGVGEDTKGNIYVASRMSGTVLESYAPSGQRNWKLYGLEFVECADIDPESPNDVYTAEHHYVLDASKPSGQDSAYVGYLVDALGCPDDPRIKGPGVGSMFFRKIQGKKFLFGLDMNAGTLQAYRFTGKGELTVPSAMIATSGRVTPLPPNHPEKTGWIWRDGSGDLFDPSNYEASTENLPGASWSIDTKGDVWTAYTVKFPKALDNVRHFPCGGLDDRGNPVYSFKTAIDTPAPAPFDDAANGAQITRMQYIRETDTMYLSGFTAQHKNEHRDWKTSGPVMCRYDHWSTAPVKRWEIVVPFETSQVAGSSHATPDAFSVAGNRLFNGYAANGEIRIYDTTNGKYLGSLLAGPEVDKTSGWIDTMYGVRAAQLADGSYIVFAEEVWHEKVLIYRIPAS